MVDLKPDPHLAAQALNASRTNRGHTWPNPSVGCILVNPVSGEIVATGSTQLGGRPHAEMDALTKAGNKARGTIAYVTLEPCNHTSENKPVSCCDALIAAGVAGVIIGMTDPDPRMAGKSIKKLCDVAIPVHVGFPGATLAHRNYASRHFLGRPRVILKLAHSPDGKIGIEGERTNITDETSWDHIFSLRSKVDAVMVGIGTALVDNPRLNDRRKGATLQPIRIVVDPQARLPLNSNLVQSIAESPVWIICAEGADTTALENAGITAIPCRAHNNRIDMNAAMHALAGIGLNGILCEGGAALASDMLKNNLVDEAIMIEGTINLGARGIPMPEFDLVFREEDRIGQDVWRYYDSQAALDFLKKLDTV